MMPTFIASSLVEVLLLHELGDLSGAENCFLEA
jgi:hypothetical protein